MNMLNIAIKAVKEAAKISLPAFTKKKNISYKNKEGEEEIVTDIDLKAEKAIKAVLKKHFPDHNFLGEEQGKESQKSSDFLWLIDPLDGTVNYCRDIKLYGISLALAKKKDVILGVVYNPLTNELFTAQKGQGAFLNNQKIKVSSQKELSNSVIYTTELYKTINIIKNLIFKLKNLRITSSAAYETCLVACGRTDGFIKVTTNPWGFAAANLIVKEAGGKVTNFNGSKWNIDSTKMLITNDILHNKILKLLNKL